MGEFENFKQRNIINLGKYDQYHVQCAAFSKDLEGELFLDAGVNLYVLRE